jgi:hypothetical protein
VAGHKLREPLSEAGVGGSGTARPWTDAPHFFDAQVLARDLAEHRREEDGVGLSRPQSGAHMRQPPRTRRSPPLRGAGERRRASRSARRRASPERVHDAGNQRAEATRAAATSSTVAFSASPIAATARLGDWTSRRSGFTERPSSLGGEHLASFETELAPLWWGSHIELRRHPTSRGVPRVRDASGLQGLSTVDRCDRDRTTREPAVPGCRDRARSRQVRPDTAPVDDRLHPGSLETRVHLGGRRCVPGTQVR